MADLSNNAPTDRCGYVYPYGDLPCLLPAGHEGDHEVSSITPNMPASEVSRPWTPGPWKASSHCLLNGRKNPFDSDLIALAPEMAEAILAWWDSYERMCHEYAVDMSEHYEPDAEDRAMVAVVDKLRAIGATDA